MSPLQTTQYAFWLVEPVLLVMAATLMIRRKLYREFPLFLSFLIFQVVLFLALYLNHQTVANYKLYFWTYWGGEMLSIALGFAVIYELFLNVFQPYGGLRDLGALLFRWAVVVLAVVAVITAASSPGTDASRLIAGIVALERSASFVRLGLLLFLFLLSGSFGLRWRDYAFGIALGFGVHASVQLAAMAIRGHVGSIANLTVSLINSAAYLCGLLIWVSYLLAPSAVPVSVKRVPAHDLDRWNRALLELLHQ